MSTKTIKCSQCGENLTVHWNGPSPNVLAYVDPCPRCQKSRNELSKNEHGGRSKFNPDLCRELILHVNQHRPISSASIQLDYPPAEIAYHVELLVQEGLFIVGDLAIQLANGKDYTIRGLSKRGRVILNAIQNSAVWERIKATVFTFGK